MTGKTVPSGTVATDQQVSHAGKDATNSNGDSARVMGDALRRSLYYTTLAWFFGAFWMAAVGGGTITELAKFLGANDFVFGIMAAAPFIAVFFQLPGSLAVEYFGRRKGIFLWWSTLHRAVYLGIAALPWILPPGSVGSAYVLACAILISYACNSVGGQAWVNWMADLVPVRVRGRYFAKRSRYGLVVIMLTSLLIGILLDLSRTPTFISLMAPVQKLTGLPPLIALISAIMVLAAFSGMTDIQLFRKVDEPAMANRPSESLVEKLSRPTKDPEFRRYLAYAATWAFSVNFCGAFWWVYMLDFLARMENAGQRAWWVDHKYIITYLPLACGYQIGQLITLPLWGKIIDRFGKRTALFVSSSLHTISWLPWLFISPGIVQWLIITQIAGGMLGAGQDIANFNMTLSFNRKGGPAYQAMTQIGVATAAALATISAGTLAKLLIGVEWRFLTGTTWEFVINRYSIIIMISVCIKYLCDIILLPRVHEPEAKSRLVAVRYFFGIIYADLDARILAPLQKINPVKQENIEKWFK